MTDILKTVTEDIFTEVADASIKEAKKQKRKARQPTATQPQNQEYPVMISDLGIFCFLF